MRAYADSHRRRLTICRHKDYWTDTTRKATENPELQKHANTPGLLDYFEALIKPTTFIIPAKMNIEASFEAAKASLKTLLKKL